MKGPRAAVARYHRARDRIERALGVDGLDFAKLRIQGAEESVAEETLLAHRMEAELTALEALAARRVEERLDRAGREAHPSERGSG